MDKTDSSSGFILQVKTLTKVYKDAGAKVKALDKVNFTLKKGESVAIIGPSGSGKTTLLELIGGLNFATSGVVKVENRILKNFSDNEISKFRNETIGFVFQMMHLQDYFTALENITLPMIAAGISKAEGLKRAEELLEAVGLSSRKDHYPKQLSGGEMQRVALARALSNKPKIVMADEPTGKLDRKNSDKVMDLLMKVDDDGTSLVLITHDERVAERFSRIITIENGRIINDSRN